MRGNNTAAGADGKTPATAFVFPYPYTGPAKLWFKVTVVVGGTRSSASDIYGPIIMGALSNCNLLHRGCSEQGQLLLPLPLLLLPLTQPAPCHPEQARP